MNIYRDPLDILFRLIPPEEMFATVQRSKPRNTDRLTVNRIPPEIFDRYSHEVSSALTADEVERVLNFTTERMQPFGQCKGKSIFVLLPRFTDKLLNITLDEPVCKSEHLLRWRDISFRLGQDIFTTAHLAACRNNHTYFGWPAVIRSDNQIVKKVMDEGIAENHFHLEGSSPVFDLSWICLMNHPDASYQMERNLLMRYDRHPTPNYSAYDQRLPWSERLLAAAWIRTHLFELLEKKIAPRDEEFSTFFRRLKYNSRSFFQRVSWNRTRYGRKFSFYNQKYCLDYAYTNSLKDKRNDNLQRLLVGERYFLYRCFQKCFDGSFTASDQNLFYLYLLIKSNFRGELVQINRRIGFHNFYEYQSRKTYLWNSYPEYCVESYRLSVGGTLKENRLASLEARIMTTESVSDLQDYIYDVDARWLETEHGGPKAGRKSLSRKEIETQFSKRKADSPDFFYVLHFPKLPLSPMENKRKPRYASPVRLGAKREANRRMAMALALALQKNSYLRHRIRGIDACSAEIGCRPEVFATEFRFLSNLLVDRNSSGLSPTNPSSDVQPRLGMTYHVGEDFISIEDGLRAIDEAVSFLNLGRGSRLGHALALGVDPETHYNSKGRHVLEKKQDRLDNIVWLLFKARQFSVPVPSDLSEELKAEAQGLLDYIYGAHHHLRDYFESWKLRGNHPDVIQKIKSEEKWSPPNKIQSFIAKQYEISKENHFFDLKIETNDPIPTGEQIYLAYDYFFNKKVNNKGDESCNSKNTQKYITLLRNMQNGMVRYLAEKGINIESNLSSNVLIGSFDRYDQHPIFRFYPYSGAAQESKEQLIVSINTDDQGIFDTSLENEYALLACSLSKQRKDDSPIYHNTDIRNYLTDLSKNGRIQTFPSADDQ